MVDEIYIKNQSEIEVMRVAGKKLAQILNDLKALIKPNMEAWELEQKFLQLCINHNVEPVCKGYTPGYLPPFPTGLCFGINSQSVHCFPKKGQIIKDGDLITVDTSVRYKKLFVDSAFTVIAGKGSEEAKNLINITETAMYESIKKVKENVKIGLISNKMQKVVEEAGFNVLKDYAGHGIGYSMHEWPEIACYGSKFEGPRLKEGMTICIEALVCSGSDEVINTSEWETKMLDSGLFAIFEHTVLVKKNGYEILTKI